MDENTDMCYNAVYHAALCHDFGKLIIIDLTLCADCLDAATDSVGRSYRSTKTFEDFIAEVRPELGVHYAPWLLELIAPPDVRGDLERPLDEGRRETYRDTCYLLRAMCDGPGE